MANIAKMDSAEYLKRFFVKTDKRIFFVMAAWNEEKRIAIVLRRLKLAGYENIVVVDDCSKDRTSEIALREGVAVLRHPINRGQGAALQTGMAYALKHGADIIVHFDSDGQHRIEDLPAMLRPVLEGKVQVALGSRFLDKKNAEHIPAFRRLTLKIGVLIIRIFYGLPLSDAHNGFRVMTREAAKKIRITSDRMEHASEIVDLIKRNRISYTEVPVVILYDEYTLSHGQGSFMQGVRVGFKMLWRKFVS
ncbi:MAG: glycosyltransferase family 2 protein [Candidatus Woesearchaeota archaeon]